MTMPRRSEQRLELPVGMTSAPAHREGQPANDIRVAIGDLRVGPRFVDLLMEIGRERQWILESMRAALLRGDEDEALERARELTGLPAKRPNLPKEDEEETESMNAALGFS